MFRQVRISFKASLQTQHVICTGFYDEWCAKTEMQETVVNIEKGMKLFSILLHIPLEQSTVVFKFIVDGCWQLSPAYGSTFSGEFENNFIDFSMEPQVMAEPVKRFPQDEAKKEKKHLMTNVASHDSALEMADDHFLNEPKAVLVPDADGTRHSVPARCTAHKNSRKRKQHRGKGKRCCSRSGKNNGKGKVKRMTW